MFLETNINQHPAIANVIATAIKQIIDMPSVNLFLDKRTKNSDGEHPVKIVVNHSGKQRLFSTRLFFTKLKYDSLSSSLKHDDKWS